MQKYKCTECGWVGTQNEMEADVFGGCDDTDEIWSNWICPKCQIWQNLEDYEKLTTSDNSSLAVQAENSLHPNANKSALRITTERYSNKFKMFS